MVSWLVRLMVLLLIQLLSNEVEVLFGDAVKIDTLEIEKKIKADGMDVIVSKFDHVEEFLMIYGLPLSNNMDFVEKKIKEAIKPFVKKIIDVFPCVHKAETDDFFKGHFDGSWRVKVEPKVNRQVPNYIVVDSTAQVLAKAVYNIAFARGGAHLPIAHTLRLLVFRRN